jgi:hypothetical protein
MAKDTEGSWIVGRGEKSWKSWKSGILFKLWNLSNIVNSILVWSLVC